ncbi:MAG: TldD/PmbA family protein [Ardenticatenales bacterium]|nr:TldD/PmbA family protein [Ardenticatenales bacterium]
MRDYTDHALDTARALGASYADVRVSEKRNQHISVKNGLVEAVAESTSAGFGVRLLVNGGWGFSSSYLLTFGEIDRVVDQAVQIAKASALVRSPKSDGSHLGPAVTSVGSYTTPYEIDPFTVPLGDKVELLLEADRHMRAVQGIAITSGTMHFQREHKYFANSEGAFIEQLLVESGSGISAMASAQGEFQRRSYPNSFGGQYVTGGYEHIRTLDLVGNAERVASEAVALLSAPPCPGGTFDLIIGGSQVALQVHESCGHPIELDRVFGTEAAYAGTSFLTPEKLYNFQYGSEIVNIVADATTPTGLGTFGFDDEGIPAQRTDIVRDGQFVGYLTNREEAQRLHRIIPDAPEISNGTMRADGWNRLPLIRMTNINLLPGSWTVDNLIAATENGLYLDINRSWSIDDRRLNFQFGCEVAYEIRGGKLGRMLRDPIYTGITPEFWRSCDAICDESDWVLWGLPNCGKGQPSQLSHVGHGASTARFRNVRVLGS